MFFQNNKIHKNKQNPKILNRRGFLKKATYAAPTIVALGALTKPTEAEAGFGPPPSGPTWS